MYWGYRCVSPYLASPTFPKIDSKNNNNSQETLFSGALQVDTRGHLPLLVSSRVEAELKGSSRMEADEQIRASF